MRNSRLFKFSHEFKNEYHYIELSWDWSFFGLLFSIYIGDVQRYLVIQIGWLYFALHF